MKTQVSADRVAEIKVIKPQEFVPHAFNTQASLIHHSSYPIIMISPDVYRDILSIIPSAGEYNEIGWLCTVKELDNRKFLLDSTHMPPQIVGPGESTFTTEGLSRYFTDLILNNLAAANRMLFWGHLHPATFGTSPSDQDEKQMNFFNHNDYFIRGIFNRHGRAEFTFFDYQNNVRWDDVPWMIYYPVDTDQKRDAKWLKEVLVKVKTVVYRKRKFRGGRGQRPIVVISDPAVPSLGVPVGYFDSENPEDFVPQEE